MNAGEDLVWRFGGAWSLTQALDAHPYTPITNRDTSAENKGFTVGLGTGREWARDRGSMRGRAGGTVSSGGTLPGRGAALGELGLGWNHAWTSEITHDLGAGVSAIRADQTHALPVGFASLAWRHSGDQVELRAERAAVSSTFVSTIDERNLVSLRIGGPIDWLESLRFFATADLEHDSA